LGTGAGVGVVAMDVDKMVVAVEGQEREAALMSVVVGVELEHC